MSLGTTQQRRRTASVGTGDGGGRKEARSADRSTRTRPNGLTRGSTNPIKVRAELPGDCAGAREGEDSTYSGDAN